jgi:hypothetical protein
MLRVPVANVVVCRQPHLKSSNVAHEMKLRMAAHVDTPDRVVGSQLPACIVLSDGETVGRS